MSNHFTKTLNERLKGVNLSYLSRELGIPSTLLFEWKQSKRMPAFKNLIHVRKLADFLGLGLEELLFSEESANLISSVMFEDNKRKYRIKIERLK